MTGTKRLNHDSLVKVSFRVRETGTQRGECFLLFTTRGALSEMQG